MKELTPIIAIIVGCGALVGGLAWLMGSDNSLAPVTESTSSSQQLAAPLTAQELAAYDVDMVNENNPVAVISTNYGTIELELFLSDMPITAGNFISLAEDGFYDGTKFHRVIEGFMIQGGDPITKTDEVMRYGTGGPDYTIADEHVSEPHLSNIRGTIAMANRGPQSGGSQFFINLVDNQNLDFDKPPLTSKHPVFGQVIAGMDIVDTVGQVETGLNDVPVEPVIVESVTIRNNAG
jgi:peptidylprolyl isomerase